MLRGAFAILVLLGGSGCSAVNHKLTPAPEPARRQLAATWLFDVRADEGVALAAEPATTHEPASGFERATYVVWGLPRDLLDVPFTTLNRLGIGTYFTTFGCEQGSKNARGSEAVIIAAAVTGGIVGFAQGWGAAGPHFFQRAVYTQYYSYFGAAVGAAAGFAATGAYGAAVIPLETALLRSGFDDAYLKGNHARLDVHAAWTEATVAAYERHERSLAYFPNWRYGVCGERRVMPAPVVPGDAPPPTEPAPTLADATP
ncbi:MAG: hypothetical protein IPH13_05015 [Planctomycetes bacterium]|nr:hypothetical protein [Planctomycetota bacterium]